jgi:hypothetical protein
MFWIQACHVNVYTCAHTKTHQTAEMLQCTVKDHNIQFFSLHEQYGGYLERVQLPEQAAAQFTLTMKHSVHLL